MRGGGDNKSEADIQAGRKVRGRGGSNGCCGCCNSSFGGFRLMLMPVRISQLLGTGCVVL